jgi:hypothetical protein
MWLRDLPVSVELEGALGAEVSDFVEVEAGWQVVPATGPPAPMLTIAPQARTGVPCVVVVEGEPSPEQIRAAFHAQAVDVLGWPGQRHQLLAAPERLGAPVSPDVNPQHLRVHAAAGGAGASTVALAVGALSAWSGRTTLVLGGDDLLRLCGHGGWTGPGAAELLAMGSADAAHEAAAVARPVPGVDRLSVLRAAAPDGDACTGWPFDVLVTDAGTQQSQAPSRGASSIVVCRPDASVEAAASMASACRVLVVGSGPLDRPGVRRRLGRAPDAWLPRSSRVARAGLAGRVPSSLPGRWTAQLRSALTRSGGSS